MLYEVITPERAFRTLTGLQLIVDQKLALLAEQVTHLVVLERRTQHAVAEWRDIALIQSVEDFQHPAASIVARLGLLDAQKINFLLSYNFV